MTRSAASVEMEGLEICDLAKLVGGSCEWACDLSVPHTRRAWCDKPRACNKPCQCVEFVPCCENCASGPFNAEQCNTAPCGRDDLNRWQLRVPAAPPGMLSALWFYADPENWKTSSSGFAAQYDPEPSAIQRDQGQHARDVLRML